MKQLRIGIIIFLNVFFVSGLYTKKTKISYKWKSEKQYDKAHSHSFCSIESFIYRYLKKQNLNLLLKIEKNFQIENNHCYILWVAKDEKKEKYHLFYSLVDANQALYKNNNKYIYKDKSLKKLHQEKVSVEWRRLVKGKVNHLKKVETVSVYHEILKEKEAKQFKKLWKSSKSNLRTCETDVMTHVQNEIPSIWYLTSYKKQLKALPLVHYQGFSFKAEASIKKDCHSFYEIVDFIVFLSQKKK